MMDKWRNKEMNKPDERVNLFTCENESFFTSPADIHVVPTCS